MTIIVLIDKIIMRFSQLFIPMWKKVDLIITMLNRGWEAD